MPRYKYSDIVYVHGEPAVVQLVRERSAGFPDYFITFAADRAMWVQENELDDTPERECDSTRPQVVNAELELDENSEIEEEIEEAEV